jgi:hypothetical protein
MINLTFETFDEMVAFAGQILGTQTGKAVVEPVAQNTVTGTVVAPTEPIPQAPVVQQPQAPVTPQAPTQMPTYSIDQIAVGAIQLKDAGRLGEFQQLLARFGVAALTQLQPAQLPEIAAELQKMGVKL